MGDVKARIAARAAALGFDAVGFCRAEISAAQREGLRDYLAAGHHGEMGWMAERAEQRSQPRALWGEARSVIALGLSYAPEGDALATLGLMERGNISVYARGRDYHDVVKGMLKHLAQFVAARFGPEVKVCVDTAPVMEKPLAQQAGLDHPVLYGLPSPKDYILESVGCGCAFLCHAVGLRGRWPRCRYR